MLSMIAHFLLFVHVGGKRAILIASDSRMVLEGHLSLLQRDEWGKNQLKFGTLLCVLLQSKYAELNSPVLLGGGTWPFIFA